MKWFNCEKKTRRGIWPSISTTDRNQWTRDKVIDAHTWCKQYPSDGKFYHHYTNTRWCFEKEEDAVMFALIWGGKK